MRDFACCSLSLAIAGVLGAALLEVPWLRTRALLLAPLPQCILKQHSTLLGRTRSHWRAVGWQMASPGVCSTPAHTGASGFHSFVEAMQSATWLPLVLLLLHTACGAHTHHHAKRQPHSANTRAASPSMGVQYTGSVRPGQQTPRRQVPANILRPDYADDGRPKARGPLLPWQVEVKTAADIEGMRVAGRVAREVLDAAGSLVAPGVTTDAIDALVTEETIKRGAYPSPLNYHSFPKSCCTSVNEVICHGIPDSSVLRDGDIVNIDITCYVGGYHGDCSEMFLVGDVDDAGKQLVKATYDCWQAAIGYCKAGQPFNGIGAAIEERIKPYGYSSVKEFCGHGIGKVFHTNPNILHYRNKEPGTMQVGSSVRAHTYTLCIRMHACTHMCTCIRCRWATSLRSSR